MADIFCLIFEKFTLVEVKDDSILAEDDADTVQEEENEQFVAAV